MRSKLATLYICATVLLPLGGCVDGLAAPSIDEEMAGTYQLRTINELDLPFLLVNDSFRKVEVINGAITLNLNGTFSDEIHYQITPVDAPGGPWADIITGTFVPNTGALTMVADAGGMYDISVATDGKLMQLIGEYRLLYWR
jgi:hypothetical protein